MVDLAARVKMRREQLGLSQSELARRLGKRPQTVQSLEGGAIRRPGYIVDLAHVLSVTAEWLQYGDGDPPEAPPPSEQIESDQKKGAKARPSWSERQGQTPINFVAMPYDLPIFILRAIPTRSDSTRMEEYAMQEGATEHCRRPPGLAGVANAYATYAPNDALFKYDKGDLMVVAPDRPARPGDIVLLTVQSDGGSPATHLGRLETSTRDRIELTTDRPEPMTAKFAADTVISMHKVLTMREALGF